MRYEPVIKFWFEELKPEQWFKKDAALDAVIRERFGDVHAAAARGETAIWRQTPEGRLSEIIVLDQFSRNMFRGTPQAFAYDTPAEELARDAIEVDADREVPDTWRHFFYMPLMHSESRGAHELALQKFTELGNEEALKYEKSHKEIIDRFGRYPHRNAVLGRESTPEESQFLAEHKEDWF